MNTWYRLTALLIIGFLTLLPEALAQSKLTPLQRRLVSGFVSHELDQRQVAREIAAGARTGAAIHTEVPSAASSDLTAYFPVSDDGCEQQLGFNIKINQNCLNLSDPDLQGRAQAQNETAIAEDSSHPGHFVASFNDYRRGDGTCGVAFSTDSGKHWTDVTTPNGFARGAAFGGVARQYWEAGGDTSVAWDTKGNAYLACQTFDRGASGLTNNPDQSSAVYVFRATRNKGASWNFPGRPVVQDFDETGASLQDKPYMTVDNHVGSPFQDRIYVTWTDFAADGTAYIRESHSNDYGEHFSAPVVVSLTSTLCVNTFGAPTPNGACNENQDSQPFTGSDGTLYVVFDNFNNNLANANDNHNQIFLVKSTDGGLTFSSPVLVANYFDLPDCATYQGGKDPGRACVPEKGTTTNSIFRASNYPSGAVNPGNAAEVAITFGSYINRNSKESNGCTPNGVGSDGNNLYTGVKTPGACANQILLSLSTNGGITFTGGSGDPRTLTVVSVQKNVADAFFQWTAYTSFGRLAASFYDRSFGTDNATGFMDVSVVAWDGTDFDSQRATSSSMPPPTQFGGLFFGDYAGLTAGTALHPVWADTRNNELFLCPGTGTPGVPPQVCTATATNAAVANDQEIFTASLEH